MTLLLQDRKEAWKYAECTGGSMMKKFHLFPVETFKEVSQLRH